MSKQLFLLRLKIGNKWLVQEKKKEPSQRCIEDPIKHL